MQENLENRHYEAQSNRDPDLEEQLTALEKEVASKIPDIRIRNIPVGLIKFSKNLLNNATSGPEVKARERTVSEIIKMINQLIG